MKYWRLTLPQTRGASRNVVVGFYGTHITHKKRSWRLTAVVVFFFKSKMATIVDFFLVRLSYVVVVLIRPFFSRRHVDACIKDALSCAVKIENEAMVIGILTNFCNNKKIKTLSDTTELVEHAIYSTAVEENSAILQTILKWNQVGVLI